MKIRTGLLILFTAACLQGAYASKIDLTGRFIPFQVTETNILTGTLQTRFIPSGKAIQVKPDFSNQPKQQYYALIVPTEEETTVTINSQVLEVIPVERRDAKVYAVFPSNLQAGEENTIRIERATAGSWANTVMFNLIDSMEEAHFAEAFWEPEDSSRRVTRDHPPTNSQAKFDVLWYDCHWKPSMTTSRFLPGTEVTMAAQSLDSSLQTIDLNFDMNPAGNGGIPMTISYVDSGPGTPALTYSYNASDYLLSVHFPAAIPNGSEFKVRVGYSGTPNPSHANKIFGMTAYITTTANGAPTVFTASQPYGGRVWWPHKDHPSDKATTSIQRITVPTNIGYNFTAISNGTLTGTPTSGAEKTFIWENSYPIAPYLISMAVGNYAYVGGNYTSLDNSKTMSVGHWVYSPVDSSRASDYMNTIQMMNFFAERFGEYPFLNEKYETATWTHSSGIEHQTCTTMPTGDSYGGLGRRNIHELAHQWFGNKITCNSWDHLWLQEGMATYCEALYYQHIYGNEYFQDYINNWRSSGVNGPAVSPNGHNFTSAPYYRRGAWIWHMLRGVLGDDAFYAGCRNFLSKGYTTAVSQPPGAPVDLQSSMEEGAGLPTGSLSTFFNQWLYSPNANYEDRPTYSLSAAYDIDTSSALINIGQHQGGIDFQMPVEIRFTDADSNTTSVIVPMGSSSITAPMGDFIPVSAELDPDDWILHSIRCNINTSSLPSGIFGEAYSTVLSGSGSGTRTWTKVTGPSWLSVSSGGTISGTPPAVGNYTLTVQLLNGGFTQQATYDVIIAQEVPPPAIVINEVLYENSLVSGNNDDNAEYIELYNTTNAPVNMSNWQIVIISSSGNAVDTVTIPASTTLAAGDYYVIGNAATINTVYPGAVDQSIAWSNALPDSTRSAIVLKTNTGKRVDSLFYMSDGSMSGGSEASFAMAEGGTGRLISAAISDTAQNVTLGRLPNGKDTGSNLNDFSAVYPSPGAPNQGISLPFFDDFNSGARPEWRVAFQEPVRVTNAGSAGISAPPAPAGGTFLEVYDSTGGGDVNFLPGAFNKLNVEGYIWISSSSSAFSTGVGIGSRVESAWFSSSNGFGLEHGFYLEFQTASGINLKSSRIANAPGQARLLACNSSGAPGVGHNGFTSTALGTPATPATQSWQPFRLYYDIPANKLFASIGESTIYDGTIPSGFSDLTGGVVIGFRENMNLTDPSPGNGIGTWVDNILVNDNTSGISDYNLY